MTLKKWAPIFFELPEVKDKSSLDRDRQAAWHLTRLLGHKLLGEFTTDDLFDYRDQRRKETQRRHNKWTAKPVKDGTIRIELSTLSHMLAVARRKPKLAGAVAMLDFKDAKPEAGQRDRVLRDDERERLLKHSPTWLRRIFIVALESCLSRSDLLALTWDAIDEENGEILVFGGRKKTGVKQVAPLTPAVREVFDEIRAEQRRMKVSNISNLVFVRKDGKRITGDMCDQNRNRVLKLAGVKDFRLHDARHTAKTRWAREGIGVDAAMLGAGHKSVEMYKRYIHLQKGDIGKAFGTALPRAQAKKTK